MFAHLLIYLTLSERISGRTHCLHFLGLTYFDVQDISESLSTVPEETIKKGGCMGGGRHCQKWVKTIGSGKCLIKVFNFNSIGYVFYRVQRVQCFLPKNIISLVFLKLYLNVFIL